MIEEGSAPARRPAPRLGDVENDPELLAWSGKAAEAWAEVWSDSWLGLQMGTKLTCVEAEAVATLLRATGREDAAAAFVDGHAEGDEYGDAHYPRTVVYSRPGCVQCTATHRAMQAADIVHDVVDVSEDDDAIARIKALGYMEAPVVIAARGREHWSGFRPDKIATLEAR